MQRHQLQSVTPTSSALARVAPVPRRHTSVGGFVIDTSGLPPLQSGQSGERFIADQAEDPKAEAKAEVLALIVRLAELAQDIDDDRHIQAAESLKAVRRQVDAADGYVQYLARKLAVPGHCPRCKVTETHDDAGKAMCELCVAMTYGRAVVR